ncbi:hypothetical protein B0H17DRAFT_911937, partial [Mycena rosella]
AQVTGALRELRKHLRTWMFAHSFKRKHMSGQGAYTKSQALQSRIEECVRGAATSYCTARAALLKLQGMGDWDDVLRTLEKGDIRGMNE